MVSLDGASAAYNMALAGTGQKLNVNVTSAGTPRCPQSVRRGRGWSENGRVPRTEYPFLGLTVDKLRLGAWVRVQPAKLGEHVWGCHNFYVQKGLRRGGVQPMVGKAWTAAPGEPGGVYIQLTDDGRCSSRRLVVEFNPAKMDEDVGWYGLGVTLRKLGVPASLRGVWVDRVDAAFDWEAPRCALFLDDRHRMADFFGLGPRGPQTERTGFRRGSRRKFQLYDKTAERKASGAGDVRADVTRFEVQLLKPDRPMLPLVDGADGTEALPVVGLADLGWPGGDVTVRCLPYHPMGVEDFRFAAFLAMCRGLGVRAAVRWARDRLGVRHSIVDDWLWLGCPEVCPSPRLMWARHWCAAATSCVERLAGCMSV